MLCHFALLRSCFDPNSVVIFKIEQLIFDSNAKCTSAKAMTPKPPKRPIKNKSRAEANARKEWNGREKIRTADFFVLDPFHARVWITCVKFMAHILCYAGRSIHQNHFFLAWNTTKEKWLRVGKKSQRKSSSIRIDFCGNLFLTAFFESAVRQRSSAQNILRRENNSSYSTNKDGPQSVPDHTSQRRNTIRMHVTYPFYTVYTRLVRITHKCQFNINGMEMRHIHMCTNAAAPHKHVAW